MTTTWSTPDADADAPRRSRTSARNARRSVVALAGLLALLFAAGGLYLAVRSRPAPSGVPVRPLPLAAPGLRLVAGVPVGYAHTEAGARSAAANYVVAFGGPAMLVPDRRHELLNGIADPALLPGLQGQQDASYDPVEARFGLDAQGHPLQPGVQLVARVVPAGVQTIAYTPDTAVVSVWEDALEGLAGPATTQPVTQLWATATLTLRWAAGDWKWHGETGTPGPVPVLGVQEPSDSSVIAAANANFGELDYAARD